MADAGKIMIMPKGAYDASASYEVLDLVTHKGNVWVAKRNVTGVEPSEANSEDWFLMADLANYLPLSGGKLNAPTNVPLELQSGSDNTCAIKYIGVNGVALGFLGLGTEGQGLLYNKDGQAVGTLLHTGNVGDYALTKSGGEITPVNSDTGLLISGTESGKTRSLIRYDSHGARLGYLGFDENGAMLVDYNLTPRRILHTGNKPTGTYTGNGSATYREIKTGGIGNCVAIYADSFVALAFPEGAFIKEGSTGVVYTASIIFRNGTIGVSHETQGNTSGKEYKYEVL